MMTFTHCNSHERSTAANIGSGHTESIEHYDVLFFVGPYSYLKYSNLKKYKECLQTKF